MKRICVFCGSSPGLDPRHADLARALGALLPRRGLELVYGGGNVGLMGVLADAVLSAGGKVTGVIPRSLVSLELAHRGLTDLRIVDSMHERKALMAELSDGFIALPGGIGTIEEFFEVLTWAQLGFHDKPCGLINATGYFDQLIAFLDGAVRERFFRDEHRGMLLEDRDPAALLDRFEAYRAPVVQKWIDRVQPSAPEAAPTAGPRLIIICGLPGSGKTTLAKRLEATTKATRFCPDEWMEALNIDLYDEAARGRIEALQWTHAQHLLAQGQSAIIEWGTWGRSERDTLRLGARALGAAVELRYLSASADELFDRIQRRGMETPPIQRAMVDHWFEIFQEPTPEECALYDGPSRL